MKDIIANLPLWIEAVAQVFFAVSIAATVIVRMTPTKADDAFLDTWLGKFLKAMSYLPTIGINPRTQKLEEALKDLKGQ